MEYERIECPPEDILAQIALRFIPRDQSIGELTQHALFCESCSDRVMEFHAHPAATYLWLLNHKEPTDEYSLSRFRKAYDPSNIHPDEVHELKRSFSLRSSDGTLQAGMATLSDHRAILWAVYCIHESTGQVKVYAAAFTTANKESKFEPVPGIEFEYDADGYHATLVTNANGKATEVCQTSARLTIRETGMLRMLNATSEKV